MRRLSMIGTAIFLFSASPGAWTVPLGTYVEGASYQAFFGLTPIGESKDNGVDDTLDEEVLVSAGNIHPIGTADGFAYAETLAEKGGQASTHSSVTVSQSDEASLRINASTAGMAVFEYFVSPLNKGLEITTTLEMPITVRSFGMATATQMDTGNAFASATLSITDEISSGALLIERAAVGAPPNGLCEVARDECGSITITENFAVNTAIVLRLTPGAQVPTLIVKGQAHASVSAKGALQVISLDPYEVAFWGGWGSAQAFVDPAIYIDPTWEYADWFELEFSANVQPVPVPAAGGLLISGLLFVAGSMKRTRRRRLARERH